VNFHVAFVVSALLRRPKGELNPVAEQDAAHC